jgi:hypothetical protein
VAMGWIVLVLAINTINYVVYQTVQMLITVDIFEEKFSTTFEIYQVVCLFWVDILCLTNGMCFLVLFKLMATAKSMQRRKTEPQQEPGQFSG